MAKDVKARYAIVRVDDKCPIIEDLDCCNCDDGVCDDCKLKAEIGNYGDTKEQLVKKIAQAIFRRKLRLYKKILGGTPLSTERKYYYEKSLEIAEEIIKFLGVEDGRKNI